MPGGTEELAEREPHRVRKGAAETDGEFVRFESTMYPPLDEVDTEPDLPHEPWGLDNDFEHVHPDQEERWEVLSGELRVEYDGETHTLTAGEDIVLPADVPHRHYNPTADPIRVVWERHPAYRSVEWAESVYALAQAGETDEEGVPGPLQIAVWIDEYPQETAYPAVLPVGVQQALASVVAPLARALGIEATYERETVDAR